MHTGFPWPNTDVPVAFVEAGGAEERTGAVGESATSFANPKEAALLLAAVTALLAAGGLKGGAMDLGVITPYSGQERLALLHNNTITLQKAYTVYPLSLIRNQNSQECIVGAALVCILGWQRAWHYLVKMVMWAPSLLQECQVRSA